MGSDRILDAAGVKDNYNWDVTVVNFSDKNAFVLPNGKIVVFRGILPVAKTEAGLAAIIGHEVGHVVAHHQAERASQQLLVTAGLQVLDLALVLAKSQYRPLIGVAVGLGALYGYQLPFSREHESEADHLGLLFMAKAGYDPAEAVAFWERLEAQGGSGPWEYLSTHPSPGNRRVQLLAWLPEAKVLYAERTHPLPPTVAELRTVRPEYSSQAAEVPVAPRPSFLPGYWWHTQASNKKTPTLNQYVRNVPCAEALCGELKAGDSYMILNQDYAWMEARPSEGPVSLIRFSPPMKTVQFPLRVGDRWSQELTVRGVHRQTGQEKETKATLKGEVVGYEPVSVRAGSFMAFKVVLWFNDKKMQEYWYAPEVRNTVRSITPTGLLGSVTSEVMDYQKTDEPVLQPEKEG